MMKKTVLIVEDNDDIRDNTAEYLAMEGFETVTAENGERAIELAKRLLPDLILCDVVMSGIDGYEVYDVIKNDPVTSGIPIIFSTAQSQVDDIHKASLRGIRYYLVKPFDGAALVDCINRCLQEQK